MWHFHCSAHAARVAAKAQSRRFDSEVLGQANLSMSPESNVNASDSRGTASC